MFSNRRREIASEQAGRHLLLLSVAAVPLLLLASCASAPAGRPSYPGLSLPVRPGQHPYSALVRAETKQGGVEEVRINFLLYVPYAYFSKAGGRLPLILFLHGIGERGYDLDQVTWVPLPRLLMTDRDFPAIVLSPQLPPNYPWWSDLIEPINVLLDQLTGMLTVDPERLYLTGISLGGFGAWEYALRYPHRFAAVVPIAGGYLKGLRLVPQSICSLRDLPIWDFHGGRDVTVPAFMSELLVKALRKCGGNVRFTLYADAGHEESWNRAYDDPELYRWLFLQRRESG